MTTDQEIEAKFWKALKSDRTIMLGLEGVDEAHMRPMTAQFEDDKGPLWLFSSRESSLCTALDNGHDAVASFASKGHDVFATIHGSLSITNDPAVIDRLWNPFVAAWYEGGKQDPALVLFRLDAVRAEIWLDGSSFFAGVKMLLGIDPKQDYSDKIATIQLN